MRIWLLTLALAGCHTHGEDEHGHGHGHGHDDEASEARAHAPTWSLTRWSGDYELFVDFAPPALGQPVQYTAHVTALATHRPVAGGMIEVDWLADAPVASFVAFEQTRPGVFRFSAPAPERAGQYTLRFTFRGDTDAVFDLGRFALGSEPAAPPPAQHDIAFTKEAQWQVPFAVRPPEQRRLGRSVRVSALVEAAPGQTRALTAPVAGHLEWNTGAALPVGARIEPDQVLATVFPAATDANWSTVRLQVREGEVERDRARSEVRRLAPLVEQGLVPGRQLDEAKARLARARARLDSARQQRDQSKGKRPEGIPVRAGAGGVIVELGARDGAVVSAGQPLARVVSEGHWHLHADVLPSQVGGAGGVRAAWVELPGVAPVPVNIEGLKGRALVADPHSGLAPIEFEAPPGDWVLGTRVPVRLTVGPAEPVLSVPRSAIVEINTRPYVFVMTGGESLTRRAVEIGPSDALYVGITRGLAAEDRVVSRGGFDVYVASLAGTLDSHTH